jgi:hypothetical protein
MGGTRLLSLNVRAHSRPGVKMMYRCNRVRAKLIQTIKVLATADGDIWVRLWFAQQHFSEIRPEELPQHLQEEYFDVLEILAGKEPRWINGYPIRKTRGYITKHTAQKVARKLFGITEKLRTMYETKGVGKRSALTRRSSGSRTRSSGDLGRIT